jgi:hypothetical protein
MAKPWYRLAMIEDQKVGTTRYYQNDVNQYTMGMGWTAVTGEDKNNKSYFL